MGNAKATDGTVRSCRNCEHFRLLPAKEGMDRMFNCMHYKSDLPVFSVPCRHFTPKKEN